MKPKFHGDMTDSRVGTDKVQHEPGASYGARNQGSAQKIN